MILIDGEEMEAPYSFVLGLCAGMYIHISVEMLGQRCCSSSYLHALAKTVFGCS